MRERVSIVRGKTPVILVTPHGSDDTNTDIIAEVAAGILDCNAVINRGFERADSVDVNKDKADCNRCDHVKQEVVFEEYLQPLQKTVDRLLIKHGKLNPWWDNKVSEDPIAGLILHIHGCGNLIHNQVGKKVAIVIGYGLGNKKHSITCSEWRKNLFMDLYRQNTNAEVCTGKGGGKFAGRDSNNMNQFYRKHSVQPGIESLQLEFPFSTRNTQAEAKDTGLLLAAVVSEMLLSKSYNGKIKETFI